MLADNVRLPIQTETIFRDGDSPTSEATSKIGASAVVGAILGAVIGGKKGAVIGGTAGAAGGTATVAAGGRNEASIPAGSPLTVRLTSPLTVMVERQQARRSVSRRLSSPAGARLKLGPPPDHGDKLGDHGEDPAFRSLPNDQRSV